MIDLSPLWLTAKLALITTLILLVISIPIAHWLSSGRSKIKTVMEALISMPLVLPPSVLGFYLHRTITALAQRTFIAFARRDALNEVDTRAISESDLLLPAAYSEDGLWRVMNYMKNAGEIFA